MDWLKLLFNAAAGVRHGCGGPALCPLRQTSARSPDRCFSLLQLGGVTGLALGLIYMLQEKIVSPGCSAGAPRCRGSTPLPPSATAGRRQGLPLSRCTATDCCWAPAPCYTCNLRCHLKPPGETALILRLLHPFATVSPPVHRRFTCRGCRASQTNSPICRMSGAWATRTSG